MNYGAWLTLANAYVSVAEFSALSARFGVVDDIVRQSHGRLCDAGLSDKKAKAIASPNQQAISSALDWLDGDRHSLIVAGTDAYPELLAQIPGAPLLMYVHGAVDALHLPALRLSVAAIRPAAGYATRSSFRAISQTAVFLSSAVSLRELTPQLTGVRSLRMARRSRF